VHSEASDIEFPFTASAALWRTGAEDFLGAGELNSCACGRRAKWQSTMDKLNVFIGRFVEDLGAAVHAGMVVIGDRLGLYKALAAHPMTSDELAAKDRNR
jgi:hypothetical protein